MTGSDRFRMKKLHEEITLYDGGGCGFTRKALEWKPSSQAFQANISVEKRWSSGVRWMCSASFTLDSPDLLALSITLVSCHRIGWCSLASSRMHAGKERRRSMHQGWIWGGGGAIRAIPPPPPPPPRFYNNLAPAWIVKQQGSCSACSAPKRQCRGVEVSSSNLRQYFMGTKYSSVALSLPSFFFWIRHWNQHFNRDLELPGCWVWSHAHHHRSDRYWVFLFYPEWASCFLGVHPEPVIHHALRHLSKRLYVTSLRVIFQLSSEEGLGNRPKRRMR